MATEQDLKEELELIGALAQYTSSNLNDVDKKTVEGRSLQANRLDMRQIYKDAVAKLKEGVDFNALSPDEQSMIYQAAGRTTQPPAAYGVPPPQPLIDIPEDLIKRQPAPAPSVSGPIQTEFDFVKDVKGPEILDKRFIEINRSIGVLNKKLDKLITIISALELASADKSTSIDTSKAATKDKST